MYLGNQPATNFETVRKDRFTGLTGTDVTLSYAVSSVNDILVWVNSVKQDYNSYSVSGNTLTLGGSLVSADFVEIAYIARTFQSVNPPAGSVGASQIADGSIALGKLSATGTKNSTTFLRGDNTFASAGGANTPAFVVYTSGNTVSHDTITKITMNNEILDTNGLFDSTTNYRFTPNVAGKYFFSLNFNSDASATSIVEGVTAYIYKNGSAITGARQLADFRNNPVVSGAVTVSTIIDMNGSTDYVEFFGKVGVASGTPYFKDQTNAVGYKLIE